MTDSARKATTAAITIDVHDGDADDDIVFAAEWLGSMGIPGTFFIPSAMLDNAGHRVALRRAAQMGHEMASHTHRHKGSEIDALRNGSPHALAFLEASRDRHADFFGVPPRSFRSPAWCFLGSAALDELHRLGYHADSSATPQRLGLLSSTPFAGVWTTSPRAPYYLRPGLLEVPTSTFLIPAGSPTFHTLREASVLFVRALRLEARLVPHRILVLQFHPADFNPDASHPSRRARLRLSEFILSRRGGFGFKHRLRMTDARRIADLTERLLMPLASERCLTITDCVRRHQGERGFPS